MIRRTREPPAPGATWRPSKWWRVLAPDGSLWCETSNEDEARDAVRPGDKLQRLWEPVVESEWRDAE